MGSLPLRVCALLPPFTELLYLDLAAEHRRAGSALRPQPGAGGAQRRP
jgi:hypothetical protein